MDSRGNFKGICTCPTGHENGWAGVGAMGGWAPRFAAQANGFAGLAGQMQGGGVGMPPVPPQVPPLGYFAGMGGGLQSDGGGLGTPMRPPIGVAGMAWIGGVGGGGPWSRQPLGNGGGLQDGGPELPIPMHPLNGIAGMAWIGAPGGGGPWSRRPLASMARQGQNGGAGFAPPVQPQGFADGLPGQYPYGGGRVPPGQRASVHAWRRPNGYSY